MRRNENLRFIKKYFYRSSIDHLWFDVVSCYSGENKELLEIGSGSGEGLQNTLYPQARSIFGIDIDKRVLKNKHLTFAKVGSAYELSRLVGERKFDLIYSHMVAEHIEDSEKFLRQQLNCLKNSGVIVVSTVSAFYWTSLLNNYVPAPLKSFLITHLGSGRGDIDIFPAYYNLNSERHIRLLASKLSFKYEIIRQDEPPGYLRRSVILMLLYTLVHKPLQAIFPSLRGTFIVVIRASRNLAGRGTVSAGLIPAED